jgi:lambda family phage portal protein
MTGKVFRFDEPGSTVLRKWNEERRLARALQVNTRRGIRASSGFAAGSIDRLNAGLSHWSGSINSDLDRSLVILRAGGRRLAANTSHGRRFVNLVKTNLVGGTGPILQVRAKTLRGDLDKVANDALELHFGKWARRCDVTGRMTLAQQVRVAVGAAARDGEALVRPVRDRRFPYGLAIQLLEADRLDETINRVLDNGNVIRQGVELDSMGAPVAYYIRTWHPGETYVRPERALHERIPARDLIHLYLPERAEQVRGYTWMHAVLREMDMHHGYKEAALVAARVGAAKMGIFQRREGSGPAPGLDGMADGKEAGVLQMDGGPGEFIEAPEGYELASWDPDYPHANFEGFVTACLREISTGLDVAAHNLTGNMRDVNYSSARIAELAEREMWMAMQEWLHESLMQRIYREWLTTSLLTAQITLPSGLALPADRLDKFLDVSRFQGRRWPWVDPEKEMKGHSLALNEGLTSRTRIAASLGVEFEDVIDELAAEQAYAEKKGVKLGAPKPGAEPSSAADPDKPEKPEKPEDPADQE